MNLESRGLPIAFTYWPPPGKELLMKTITQDHSDFHEVAEVVACLLGSRHSHCPNKFTTQLCRPDGSKFLLLSLISLPLLFLNY